MRKRIYEIIEVAREGDRLSNVYDVFMMVVITLSLLPLMFKESYPVLVAIDRAAVVIFTSPSCATPSPSWPSSTC